MTVKIGDKVPLFTLKDQNNQSFSINEMIGKKNLVIYFYPKDDSMICTAEAEGFRDATSDFSKLDALIIGISPDGVDSHQDFAKKYKLPFKLLSDHRGEVQKRFGVAKDLFGLIPGRATYVVNKEGFIIHIFDHAFSADKHIDEALKSLQSLHTPNN